jgi:hypothetical protein
VRTPPFFCAALAAVVVTGCSMYGGGPLDESSPGVVRNASTPVAQAQSLVRPGASTKAEVTSALGPANVIRFDSGWEVWVYRWLGADRTARSATELVVLFDPSGTVRKTRVRAGASGG